jgi:hypothetical protein
MFRGGAGDAEPGDESVGRGVPPQLLEYFFWKNLGAGARPGSVAAAAIMTVGRPLHRYGFMCAYALFVACLCVFCVGRTDFSTTVAPNGHLRWNWSNGFPTAAIVVYVFFLVAPLMANGSSWSGWVVLAILAISLYCYKKDGTWASMWCWIGALASVYYIVRSFGCQFALPESWQVKCHT